MKTPVVDYVKEYISKDISRFHMPGHKGVNKLGFESYDITEIKGADDLSCPEGIIRESEENATSLFGTAHSFYITGGSTVAIYAMLALVKNDGVILAARNVHKAFVHGCALLDLDVRWIFPKDFSSVLECRITAEDVEAAISNAKEKISAVYVTSPDYLGNIQDIKGISKVCRKYDIPLLVDNAHGAYLKFLEKSIHPIDLGATLCCDSAHKTLPVLTGGAYLHVAKEANEGFMKNARSKISLFSSTSPSYLILQSLDACNSYIDDGFKEELTECIKITDEVCEYIKEKGFDVLHDEPLKITINTKKSGYTGFCLAEILREGLIEPEFADEDFLVLMITPQNREKDFWRLKRVFSELANKKQRKSKTLNMTMPERAISIREAVFSENEIITTQSAVGRICGDVTVSCPPAVPVIVSGEVITKEVVQMLKYYGTDKIQVVKKGG